MYLSYYNLAEKPFQIDTDPRFLWFGEKHQEALAVLKYGVLDRNGFVVLTGGIGTGKTTLLNALLESLGDDVLVANINNPKLDTLDFLKIVAKSYEPAAPINGKADFILYFNRFLQRAHFDGRIVLLVIDEAHRLSQDLLEEIRLLSNAEQAGKRLINIFFIGQNELKQSLLLPECRALRQRVTLFYDIQPLSESEMVQYMGHRLRVAGSEAQLFTSDAIHEIYRFSLGFPRLINILCDHALLTGYVQGLKTISPEVVNECGREIRFPGETGSIIEKELIDNLKNRRRAAPRDPWRGPLVRRLIRAVTVSWTRFSAELSAGDGFGKKRVAKEAATAAVGNEELSFAGQATAPHADETNPGGEETKRPFPRLKRQTLFYGGLVAGIGIVAVALTLMVQATPAGKTESPTLSSGTAGVQGQGVSLSRSAAPVPSQPPAEEIGLHSAPAPEKGRSSGRPPEKRALAAVEPVDGTPAPESPKPAGKSSTAGERAAPSPAEDQKTQRFSSLDLAKGALAQKNYQLALELLDATRNPDRLTEFKPLYARALAGQAGRLLEKSPLEAETMLRKAVALDSKNVESYFFLGKLYTRSKDYARAIVAYQKAVGLDPDLADALFNLGFIYASTGMYEDAEKMFARAVRTHPPYLDKALFNLAMVQQKLGKKEESRTNLEKAVAVKPDNQKAQTFLKQFKAAAEAGR
ncbi:MAG: tetratricopeptide repeat protein [Desulfobacterales bacterium]|jgi:type II secretory pathway predicted ATPase ExeA/cytochrome c-type biogenesis protein CcmH/NrfG